MMSVVLLALLSASQAVGHTTYEQAGDAFIASGPRVSRSEIVRSYPGIFPRSTGEGEWTTFDLKHYLQNFWQPGEPLGASCEHLVRLGSVGDGGKLACNPLALGTAGTEGTSLAAGSPCLVVSVGHNSEASFEAAVESLAPTCDVHTIDPMLASPAARTAFVGSSSHRFAFGERFSAASASLPRYAGKRVALLKLDCEGCEAEALLPWVRATCTEQILVEVHTMSWPADAQPLKRLLRTHKLLSALEPEYAVFSATPNMLAGEGMVIEYGLKRRASCFGAQASPAKQPLAPPSALAPSAPRVAVCLVGQLRSLNRTAASLQAFLLDALDADAFVVATTDSNAPPTDAERRLVALLGPRVRHTALGTEREVLDAALLKRVAKAPLHELSALHVEAARASGGSAKVLDASLWPHKVSAQLLHAEACAATVRRAEAARGKAYELYVRARLDTELFEPVPTAFHAPLDATDPALAVVPNGPDEGGINDRMFFGGTLAFEADASRWRALLENSHQIHALWTPESLHRAHLLASGIRVVREPLAYCLLRPDGACKYPQELEHSLRALPGLLTRRPELDAALLPPPPLPKAADEQRSATDDEERERRGLSEVATPSPPPMPPMPPPAPVRPGWGSGSVGVNRRFPYDGALGAGSSVAAAPTSCVTYPHASYPGCMPVPRNVRPSDTSDTVQRYQEPPACAPLPVQEGTTTCDLKIPESMQQQSYTKIDELVGAPNLVDMGGDESNPTIDMGVPSNRAARPSLCCAHGLRARACHREHGLPSILHGSGRWRSQR